jgi:hypothetical protein
MEIISRPRQQGKTTDLIKYAAENFNYIVCNSIKEVERVARLAKELKLDIPYPVTYDEVLCGRYYGRGIKGFAIDNAEQFIQAAVKDVKVNAMTITLEKDVSVDCT